MAYLNPLFRRTMTPQDPGMMTAGPGGFAGPLPPMGGGMPGMTNAPVGLGQALGQNLPQMMALASMFGPSRDQGQPPQAMATDAATMHAQEQMAGGMPPPPPGLGLFPGAQPPMLGTPMLGRGNRR